MNGDKSDPEVTAASGSSSEILANQHEGAELPPFSSPFLNLPGVQNPVEQQNLWSPQGMSVRLTFSGFDFE